MAQVGVRTRARAVALAAAAAAASTGTARKRKVNNRELMMSTSHIELRSTSRRRVIITPEKSVSVSVSPEINPGHRTLIQDRCSSPSSHHASASCCSSNGSSDHRINKFADLEAESFEVETSGYYSCRERRETTPSSQLRAESSDEMDSTARPSSAANSRCRSTAERMPTESELDDFFTEAEKNIQKQFADKYNYDIVKDKPLQGRYEWVLLKQ
ncbi:hypothetical protein P3X46_018803 [Hevea brasiliensis]|uniref:Cyclin-dependent kinase inhibitor n=2 Tax=Hevea brasiliensis TaxID=3981 RepID=A0ABQ9LRT2_HEVBR|nr:hypothetical protein P3X46_018803 [Hevea brasiliensis]